MSIVLTEMYVVKAERQAEFTPLLNEFLALKKERPELFDGLNAYSGPSRSPIPLEADQ